MMATTGGQLQEMRTTARRATRVLLLVIALTVGLMIGGVVGRLSAPQASSTHGASVTSSHLTPAKQRTLAHDVQVVSSKEMRAWERACSPGGGSSANVC